jgi:peptidoglycan/xylan/chitin deacetylase (PgdA/CDA1 family)
MDRPGAFVVSLDFELHWGVRDHTAVDGYRDNLLGVREAIPGMLGLFRKYEIHATWATVGFLFARSKQDLMRHLPERRPQYENHELSPYPELDRVGDDETSDPYHFAPSLIDAIAATPCQELATHTFSHYYCTEAGQSADDFRADLEAARRIASPYGDVLRSIVFPRNQVHEPYFDVLRDLGVEAYRGNGDHWAWRGRERATRRAERAARWLDTFVPVSRAAPVGRAALPYDVPASAFLRPFSASWPRALRALQLRRITHAMDDAARRGSLFHLWWHPHNFGTHIRENLQLLEQVLSAFAHSRRRHGMESLTMLEAARAV